MPTYTYGYVSPQQYVWTTNTIWSYNTYGGGGGSRADHTHTAPAPEPEKPKKEDNIAWLRGRVQEVVDIFDKAAA